MNILGSYPAPPLLGLWQSAARICCRLVRVGETPPADAVAGPAETGFGDAERRALEQALARWVALQRRDGTAVPARRVDSD